jgi:hypothetical protein
MSSSAVISALFRKELRSFLGNPTGYVFLTLFIVASAAAAFLTDSFFSRNLADLATLNRWMPAILMFFVPAITMGLWADERRSGTDELLLTLPVRDGEVVVGKFLGALGVYTVGLLFSLVNVDHARLPRRPRHRPDDLDLPRLLADGRPVRRGRHDRLDVHRQHHRRLHPRRARLRRLVFAGMAPWASAIVGVVLLAALGALKWASLSAAARRSARCSAPPPASRCGSAASPWFTDIFAAPQRPGPLRQLRRGPAAGRRHRCTSSAAPSSPSICAPS